jgi:hypothetical protein
MDYLSAQQYSKARDALLKEGYSEDETDRALSAHQRTYAKSSKEEPKKIDETDYLTLPVATAGGGLAVEGLRRLYNNYKNTPQNPAEVGTRIEPTFTGNAPVAPSVSPSPVQPRITTEPTATGQSTLAMLPPTAPSVPQGSIPGAPNVQATSATLPAMPPVNPAQQFVQQATGTAPNTPVPASMPIGQTTPNPVESGEGSSPLHEAGSAVGETPLQATTESTVQPGEKTVEGSAPPKKTRRPKNTIPEGEVFKEGFGGADNWLQNSVGHETRRFIRDTFNEGIPYGSGEEAMKKAYSHVNKYEQWLKENIPEQTLTRSERRFAGLSPPENYGKLGKVAKIGGVTGLLMAASQASNAKELANNIGESLLPIGATPTPIESGKLPANVLEQYKEYAKLGSPYRQAFIQQTGKK